MFYLRQGDNVFIGVSKFVCLLAGLRENYSTDFRTILWKTVVGSDNSASFTSSRMKDLCQKWKVKLIFRGAYRLSGTGIVKCLEISDVWCNLKI